MNIVQRNFFRLLRSGAFETHEQIEPMSVFKWQKLFQLSLMHDVAGFTYEGLQRCKNQFFVHLTDSQWSQWDKTIEGIRNIMQKKDVDEDEFLRADHLTNPVLNRKLQNILDDENSDTRSRQMLLMIIRCSRHILNEGVPVRQLIELGTFLRTEGSGIDATILDKWISSLKLQPVARLEASLLIMLLGITREEISFAGDKDDKNTETIAQELLELTNTHIQDFYFSQNADNIFVHTRNGSAMLGHIRRSARYFRYYPSETITNFFASFAHSLSHIEE